MSGYDPYNNNNNNQPQYGGAPNYDPGYNQSYPSTTTRLLRRPSSIDLLRLERLQRPSGGYNQQAAYGSSTPSYGTGAYGEGGQQGPGQYGQQGYDEQRRDDYGGPTPGPQRRRSARPGPGRRPRG
ncbi:hypothetical protein MRB53_040878 [Persea americana]|nr:hypothetical protein MRB53_040878 [Persea americana]